ncbi:hypothetical protein [Marinifilum sp.]|uniref:hypothetical protein n=1 Tax=Marinifilum sp. TaxID=2033137 RepID=UPI003BA92D71
MIRFPSCKQLDTMESEQWNYGINLNSRVIWKFILENRATFGQNTYFTQVGQPNKIENFNNSFQLFFKPLKNLHFKAYFNYSLPLINNLNTANKSLDAFVRYQAFKKRLVLTLEGKNLVDQRRSNLVTKADYYEESSSFNLQRQFFLLTAEWRF